MTTTIEARLVAEGVGLPAVWWDGEQWDYLCHETHEGPVQGVLELSDPHTAFGVALKLDEWERARDPARMDRWAVAVARAAHEPLKLARIADEMAARLTQARAAIYAQLCTE